MTAAGLAFIIVVLSLILLGMCGIDYILDFRDGRRRSRAKHPVRRLPCGNPDGATTRRAPRRRPRLGDFRGPHSHLGRGVIKTGRR